MFRRVALILFGTLTLGVAALLLRDLPVWIPTNDLRQGGLELGTAPCGELVLRVDPAADGWFGPSALLALWPEDRRLPAFLPIQGDALGRARVVGVPAGRYECSFSDGVIDHPRVAVEVQRNSTLEVRLPW